jgi:hypothetical protein
MPKRATNAAARSAEFEAFGRRLTKLLEAAGQERHGAGVYLSKRYGVSGVTANAWLKGEYRPNTARAREIAEDHGSTFDMLYFGRVQGPPAPASDLSEREHALIKYFRALTDADKQSIERLAGSLARAQSVPARKAG